MSIVVDLQRLRQEISRFDSVPYLLTVTGDGRPHAVAVTLGWEDDDLTAEVGSRTASNAVERASVSLLWPPVEPGGYSLIVDGTARVTTAAGVGRVTIEPSTAVLHRQGRPAAAVTGTSCTSDCIPIFGR
jgi:hypothetical protein